MARRLGSTPFRELLPDSLSGDPSIRAAAAALDTVLDATTRAIPGVLLYARLAHDTGFVEPVAMLPPLARLSELSGGLASLPEPVLDLLAWQLHVEGYEAAVDLAAKRQLIAGSLLDLLTLAYVSRCVKAAKNAAEQAKSARARMDSAVDADYRDAEK